MSLYESASFEAFWPGYVRLHARRETQAMHAAASLSFAALVVAGIATRSLLLVALAPLADYAISQASHRLFERNATQPWRRPGWHARAELRMLRLVLTGRMTAEVQRHTP